MIKLSKHVVIAKLDDGWVAFEGEKEQLYEFNEVGGLVLWLIQEGMEEVGEIVEKIRFEFGVEEKQVKQDVNSFLKEMEREGLVVNF